MLFISLKYDFNRKNQHTAYCKHNSLYAVLIKLRFANLQKVVTSVVKDLLRV